MIGLKNFIQSEVKLLNTNPQGISISDPQSCLLWWGLWPVILSLSECFETILICPCLLTNRTSLELQSLLSLIVFLFKFDLSNWGCGLSTGAAYTWTFTMILHNLHTSHSYKYFTRIYWSLPSRFSLWVTRSQQISNTPPWKGVAL